MSAPRDAEVARRLNAAEPERVVQVPVARLEEIRDILRGGVQNRVKIVSAAATAQHMVNELLENAR